MAEMTVDKIMIKKVVIAGSDMTVMKAANMMVDRKIGSLVVVSENKPVGLVTETDIVRKVVASGVSSKLITLNDIMTKKLILINKDQSVIEASKLMKKHKIKRIPVTQDEKVVGIITSTDIVDAISRLDVK